MFIGRTVEMSELNRLSVSYTHLDVYKRQATVYNIRALYDAGIWPVTLATDVLKPGGYERFSQMAGEFTDLDGKPFAGVSLEAVTAIQDVYKRQVKAALELSLAGRILILRGRNIGQHVINLMTIHVDDGIRCV